MGGRGFIGCCNGFDLQLAPICLGYIRLYIKGGGCVWLNEYTWMVVVMLFGWCQCA